MEARTFYIDSNIYQWLKQQAEKENRSVSYILNELLKKARGLK